MVVRRVHKLSILLKGWRRGGGGGGSGLGGGDGDNQEGGDTNSLHLISMGCFGL